MFHFRNCHETDSKKKRRICCGVSEFTNAVSNKDLMDDIVDRACKTSYDRAGIEYLEISLPIGSDSGGFEILCT